MSERGAMPEPDAGGRTLPLSAIMSAGVVVVGPEDTLRQVVGTLAAHGISGAPVVTVTGRVLGVVSASDILDFEEATPGVPTERPEEADWGELEDAAEAAEREERAGPYFFELWSDAGGDVANRFAHVEGPEWDILDEHTASEIMTRRVHALPPDTDVREAARVMVNMGIHRILVTEQDRLRGVVTTMDIARAVADRRI